MTDVFINIPGAIEIDEDSSIDKAKLPLIPAENIVGILQPGQIPVGVIPGVEDVVEIQDQIEALTGRVADLEQAPTLDPSQLVDHTEEFGAGGHIPPFGITNENIAAGAGIDSSKLDFSNVDFLQLGAQPASTKLTMLTEREITEFGADLLEIFNLAALQTLLQIPQIVDSPDDIGAQPVDADLTAIAQLVTTAFGRSFLALADAAAARTLLQIPQIVDSPDDIGAQPVDADLTAIAQLVTTAFGRTLLTMVDAAEARSYLGVAAGGGGGAAISELTYTVTQSSVYDAPGTVNQGTFGKLTDNTSTTGAGTLNAATTGIPQWIKADLGQVRDVLSVTLAAGTLGGGFGGVAPYLNNAQLQVSDDDANWTLISLVAGAVNTDLANISGRPTPVTLPIDRRCRYIRLWRSDAWLATTEFRIRGW